MADFNVKTALKAIAERRTDQPEVPPHGLLDPNSPQERINRARQQEAGLLEQMHWLRQQPDSELKTSRLEAMFDRLGELAGEQGDYKRAASISHDPERRLHYRGICDAIKKADDKNCNCEDDLIVDRANGQEFRSPAIQTIDRIVGKDGQLLNLDYCRKCGFANAR